MKSFFLIITINIIACNFLAGQNNWITDKYWAVNGGPVYCNTYTEDYYRPVSIIDQVGPLGYKLVPSFGINAGVSYSVLVKNFVLVSTGLRTVNRQTIYEGNEELLKEYYPKYNPMITNPSLYTKDAYYCIEIPTKIGFKFRNTLINYNFSYCIGRIEFSKYYKKNGLKKAQHISFFRRSILQAYHGIELQQNIIQLKKMSIDLFAEYSFRGFGDSDILFGTYIKFKKI